MIVDIAVPVKVPGSFHYFVEEDIAKTLELGAVLEVPFGSRQLEGFVLGLQENTDIAANKIKSITQVVQLEPVFDEAMLKFFKWVSEYYCHPLGEVIATAVPKIAWVNKKEKKSKPSDLIARMEETDFLPAAKPSLTCEQAHAVKTILNPSDDKPVLIHGVTGSGKTEIYMSVLDSMVANGKTGLVLVPEIALTPQLMNRFSSRFPGRVAVLHSELTPKERTYVWKRIRNAQVDVVIGARSAVFAPLKNLGVIIVDEEHETSFKQEDSLRYHGRDLAIVRASLSKAKVVLGSATPSIESYYHAKLGKYHYVELTQRINKQEMPKTTIVDLKDVETQFSAKVPWLTQPLVLKIQKALERKQQVMLFLNRLGYAHFLYCDDCGHTWRCKNCDVALTYYQNPPSLKCHYCAAIQKVPHVCEACTGLKLTSIGLGTEQVEKEIAKIFPTAKVERLDRGKIKDRKSLESLLSSISNREVDIVIGTQMMAKGHDFPGIALVGILVADASLNIPDFRASERTFQLITQVSGRAGRADTLGEVVVQTVNPLHPVIHYASHHQTKEFYDMELRMRKEFGFPPFNRLAMLRFQHKDKNRVEIFSYKVLSVIKQEIEARGFKSQVLGPSEAPLSKLKNYFRWQAMIKSESVKEMQMLLRIANEYVHKEKQSVQFSVDVDPMNSL